MTARSPLVPCAELDEALAALDRARAGLRLADGVLSRLVMDTPSDQALNDRILGQIRAAMGLTSADDYRIALRDDSNGHLDDVVVREVSTFRAERMDDDWIWMCCYFAGTDERLTFGVRAKGDRLGFYVNEKPESEGFTYEEKS